MTDLAYRLMRLFRNAAAALLAIAFALQAVAQPVFTPYDVEAAYLYNFGKFVHWPPDAEPDAAPFVICLLGDDPFGERLNALVANESIQGHAVVTRHIASTAAAATCQILFVAASEAPHLT